MEQGRTQKCVNAQNESNLVCWRRIIWLVLDLIIALNKAVWTTKMLQHWVARGLSCASRGALLSHSAPRVFLGPPRLTPQRRDLSAQVQVSDVEAGREVNAKVTKLADEILELNLLEISDLSSILKERLGLDAIPMGGMMPMAAAPAAATAGEAAAEAPVVEEKTSFDIKLESYDKAAKIKVIKEIRTITELGLKEAKEMVIGSHIKSQTMERCGGGVRWRKRPSW